MQPQWRCLSPNAGYKQHYLPAPVAHDILRAARALLARLLNRLETRRILLLGILVLHTLLVILARLTFMKRTIAVNAGLRAAFVANADVGKSTFFLHLPTFPRRHATWSRLLAGSLNRRFMHLPGLAARRQAPPPPRSLLGDASPLQLVEPLVGILRSVQLHVRVLHEFRALRAADIVVGRAVHLHSDPLREACSAGVDEVVAVVGWYMLRKR